MTLVTPDRTDYRRARRGGQVVQVGDGGTLGKKSGGVLRPVSEVEWTRTWGWEGRVAEGEGGTKKDSWVSVARN